MKHSNLLEKYLNTEFKGKIKIDIKIIEEDIFTSFDALKESWNKITVYNNLYIFLFIIVKFMINNLRGIL